MNGRLGEYRRKVERLTRSMQTFCLDPRKEVFDEIVACGAIARNEGDDFKVWRSACEFKYGGVWGVEPSEDFTRLDGVVCERVVKQPSKTVATQVLHAYFATGELKYIDLYYQTMGHEHLPTDTRRYLAGVYKETKSMYLETIAELVKKDKTHFEKIGLPLEYVDFTYCDNAKTRALKAKEDVAEANKILSSMT